MRYWKRIDKDGSTTTVESYSHELDVSGAIEITESEFNRFIDALPKVTPPPTRDLAAEIDEIKSRIEQLEKG